jgi:hypothetical protein
MHAKAAYIAKAAYNAEAHILETDCHHEFIKHYLTPAQPW